MTATETPVSPSFESNVIQGLWSIRNIGESAQPHSPVRWLLRRTIQMRRSQVYGFESVEFPLHARERRHLRLTRKP